MLRLDNVYSDVAGVKVLRDVSAQFSAGSITAVVGRNGAGKTTLLRTIMGLVDLKAGSIHIDGALVDTLNAHDRAFIGVGYAPEERVIFPTMSVLENILLPCEVVGQQQSAIQDRLEMVMAVIPQMKALITRSGAALSGGQGKMVALARALMVGTRVVLLDEPFQGLAPALAYEYGQSLSQLHRSQPDLAIVVTESNGALLHGIADQTLTIERGELI